METKKIVEETEGRAFGPKRTNLQYFKNITTFIRFLFLEFILQIILLYETFKAFPARLIEL